MKIKLTKLKELEDALNPNNIPEGEVIIRETNELTFKLPTIGERFYIGGGWSTSGVTEIISENIFKTYSSIYKWEILGEK
jgi:hypothetical protein